MKRIIEGLNPGPPASRSTTQVDVPRIELDFGKLLGWANAKIWPRSVNDRAGAYLARTCVNRL
jgi:hypothetical protein